MGNCVIWPGLVVPGFAPAWMLGTPNLDGTGGQPFDVPDVFPGEPLYLTATGDGDGQCWLTVSINPLDYASLVPAGFLPGWPTADFGAADVFDPAKSQNVAFLGTGNPQHIDFGAVPGVAQSATAHTAGAFYIEYLFRGDLFTVGTGMGVARLMPSPNDYFSSSRFSTIDANGGAHVEGGSNNQWDVATSANGAGIATGFHQPRTTPPIAMALAILITPGPPAAFPFRPASLQPVALSCVPCTPLVMTGGWPGRYG